MANTKILPKRFDILDANDPDCSFRINIDVLNECFGANVSMFMQACWPQKRDMTIPGTKPGDKFFVWMPKLFKNKSEWKNSISADGSMIYEVAEPTLKEDWMLTNKHDLEGIRLVFAKLADNGPYRFVGAFVCDQMNNLAHSYKRIATRVRLIGDPVRMIELLDDNRE